MACRYMMSIILASLLIQGNRMPKRKLSIDIHCTGLSPFCSAMISERTRHTALHGYEGLIED